MVAHLFTSLIWAKTSVSKGVSLSTNGSIIPHTSNERIVNWLSRKDETDEGHLHANLDLIHEAENEDTDHQSELRWTGAA